MRASAATVGRDEASCGYCCRYEVGIGAARRRGVTGGGRLGKPAPERAVAVKVRSHSRDRRSLSLRSMGCTTASLDGSTVVSSIPSWVSVPAWGSACGARGCSRCAAVRLGSHVGHLSTCFASTASPIWLLRAGTPSGFATSARLTLDTSFWAGAARRSQRTSSPTRKRSRCFAPI